MFKVFTPLVFDTKAAPLSDEKNTKVLLAMPRSFSFSRILPTLSSNSLTASPYLLKRILIITIKGYLEQDPKPPVYACESRGEFDSTSKVTKGLISVTPSVTFKPGQVGVLPYINYTSMCRPTG